MKLLENFEGKEFTGKCILLVDDNKMNVLFTRSILKDWNVKVHVAFNGEEALDLMNQFFFDLVLMDLQMPIMDGFVSTKKIRELKDDRRLIPIIAFSGTEKEKQLSIEAGMNDFLLKPFSKEELYDVISKFFNLVNINKDANSFKFTNQFDKAYLLELYDGDFSHAFEMFEIFIYTIELEFEILKNMIETNDKLSVKRQIHKIKPSFGMVGLTELTRGLEYIEQEIENWNIDKIDCKIDAFIEKYRPFLSILKNEMTRYKSYIEK